MRHSSIMLLIQYNFLSIMSTTYFVIGENVMPVALLGKEKMALTGNVETRAMVKSYV